MREASTTDILRALSRYSGSLTTSNGDRSDKSDILVVLTDGGPHFDIAEANRRIPPGVVRFVVAFGNNVDGALYGQLASVSPTCTSRPANTLAAFYESVNSNTKAQNVASRLSCSLCCI